MSGNDRFTVTAGGVRAENGSRRSPSSPVSPLGRFYTTGPGWPYFDEGGLVAGPSSLFFQWVWKEVTIDRWTWEPTVHIRRSQLLEVVPR